MNKKVPGGDTWMALCGLLQRGHGLGQQWYEWHSVLVRPDDIRTCSSSTFDELFLQLFGFAMN